MPFFQYEETRDEFHRLLGRLVHEHMMFDFNIGLQLNWLGPHNGVNVRHLLKRNVSVSRRLNELKPLILKTYSAAGDATLGEISDWFTRAAKNTTLRNKYVHGRWGLPGHAEDGEPSLRFVPLHWRLEAGRPDDSVGVTLSEFSKQVDEFSTLAGQLFELLDANRQFAAPRVAHRSGLMRKQ